jgi:trans-aconitate methyltransferase
MPMTPSVLAARPRFDPVYLTEADLEDLVSFTGLSREECLARVRDCSVEDLAESWRRTDPKTPEEILAFYASAGPYVWELMQWHASEARRLYWQALQTIVDRFPPPAGYTRVLDFGCGIGTDGLFLANHGYDVTFVDVDGPAFRFAQHRFARRGLRGQFLPARSTLPEVEGVYDVVVCFDVFEHLPDPLGAARRLVAALRPGGIMVQQGSFGEDGCHPCHLSDGVAKFSGLRWHIALAGLGLRNEVGMVYRRAAALQALAQRIRWRIWKATRLWVMYVGLSA